MRSGSMVILCACTSAIAAGAVHIGGPPALGVVLDAPDGSEYGQAWVVVVRDGNVLCTDVTEFKAPVRFVDVPPGPVQVRVIPRPNSGSDGGLVGEGEGRIVGNGMSVVRVKLSAQRAIPVTVRIIGVDGRPTASTAVEIVDVSTLGATLYARSGTSADGKLSFKGFEGRKYRVRVSLAKPALTDCESEVIAVKDTPIEIRWRLTLPPLLRLRFFIQKDGGIAPFHGLSSVGLGSANTAETFGVRDGEVVVFKNSSVLRGVKNARVILLGEANRGQLRIVKNEHVKVTEGAEQEVDVVLAARAVGRLRVRCEPVARRWQRKPKVLIVNRASGRARYVSASKLEDVDAGEYKVLAWAEGMRLCLGTASIRAGATTEVRCDLKQADTSTVVVLDQAEVGIAHAGVMVRYTEYPFMDGRPVVTDGNGVAQLNVDSSLAGRLVVLSASHGGTVRSLPGKGRDRVEVKLANPCVVSGNVKVKLPENVEGVSRKAKWLIMWTCKGIPNVVVQMTPVNGEEVRTSLQKGEYVPYLFATGWGVRLPDVVLKGDGEEIRMKPVVLDEAMWKRRVSFNKHGIH